MYLCINQVIERKKNAYQDWNQQALQSFINILPIASVKR